jgi:hypothetical protein
MRSKVLSRVRGGVAVEKGAPQRRTEGGLGAAWEGRGKLLDPRCMGDGWGTLSVADGCNCCCIAELIK